MQQDIYNQQDTSVQQFETNKVLRNTYALLAMTFLFSTVTAGIAMAINMPYMGLWSLLPFFAFLWLTEKNKDSAMGLVWVFALTGWLGLTIGPIISLVSATAGFKPILMALGGTAVIFFGLSAYVLISRKDLSFMTGFLLTGLLVAFIAGIGNVFFQIQGLSLVVSCMFLLLSSGVIAWQTSSIIHGGETNYISATVTLFVSIYNVFSSLLMLIGMGGDD
jgi:modulator of FtsH protease